jgi:hypothetical protein
MLRTVRTFGTRARRAISLAAAFGALLPWNLAAGQSSRSDASAVPDLDRFAREYYEAATDQDAARMRGLFDPHTRACIDQVTRIYFEQEVSMFPRNVTISSPSVRRVEPDEVTRMAPGNLPTDAEQFVLIDWKETSGGVTANHPSLLALNRVDGRLFAVVNCPSRSDIERRNAFFAHRQTRP